MGSVGDAYDNAMAESFFATLECELLERRRFKTQAEARMAREWLHKLPRRVEMKEIITAGQFLILTGLVLPLLPAEPVTTFTSITPRQAWFALLVVCTLSYVSYFAQHYWPLAAGGLWAGEKENCRDCRSDGDPMRQR